MALGGLTEPPTVLPRPIHMKVSIPALALAALLTACGTESGDDHLDVAGQDPTTETPTVAPTGPPWPEFAATDYTFVYSRSCYCPDATTKIRVTVVGGTATDATYAESGPGFTKGTPAEAPFHRITIADIIAEANSEDADTIEVTWPEGQEWPSKVFIDQIERGVDDEITFEIHSVQVGP